MRNFPHFSLVFRLNFISFEFTSYYYSLITNLQQFILIFYFNFEYKKIIKQKLFPLEWISTFISKTFLVKWKIFSVAEKWKMNEKVNSRSFIYNELRWFPYKERIKSTQKIYSFFFVKYFVERKVCSLFVKSSEHIYERSDVFFLFQNILLSVLFIYVFVTCL